MSSPYLAAIYIYPIKSLDRASAALSDRIYLSQANILASGALYGDREFAIFDLQGRFVNGKRNPKVHQIQSSYDLDRRIVSLQVRESKEKQSFNLDTDRSDIEAWLGNYFQFPVRLEQNTVMGFPDDTNSPGPTIISTATLEAMTSWFPGLSIEELRLRFRANLEIDGVPAFWEDRLFGEENRLVRFQIGDVLFFGVNPCQRCIVPTRDALTGESYSDFQKIFITKRKETLPSWVDRSRFNHFYRLSVNTQIPTSEAGKTLQIGDSVQIL